MALGMLAVMLAAPPATATTVIGTGTFSGTDFDFLNVQETSTFGDPEPLFGSGASSVSGNSLILFPTTFSASAAGAFGYDQTGSQLQAQIMATGLQTIDQILISEFGDSDLSGVGTGATGTFASLSGIVTVLETTGGPCVGAACLIGFTGVFSPTDTLGLPGDSGLTLWTGDAVIDIASLVPNATKVQLSLDNDLYAYSEAGTTALIQKKVGGPFTVTVVPEPTTAVLLGGGLLAIAAARRRHG